ncbi:hypothetical protein [Paraclostridium bifermentans]|uniref:hypothetical protein n=1 Tax=Paraclostridium bifermentans TaxID=1490 RepID=UPI00359C2A57
MEQIIQNIELQLSQIANSIDNITWAIENTNNNFNSTLMILLICVLISINNNIKKLVEQRSWAEEDKVEAKVYNNRKLILAIAAIVILLISSRFIGYGVNVVFEYIVYIALIYSIAKN